MTFQPPPLNSLTGSEAIAGTGASIIDFWKFAMSDLRTNNVRGYFAEFLVAQAVGTEQVRVEWDPWDVTAPDGTRIEVKSSGYLQAWAQPRLSVPSFRVAPAHGWDEATRARTPQAFNADVYVFCLHTAKTHEEYNPLATTQWAFYVASRSTIESRSGHQMGLATLRELVGEPVQYSLLASQISLRSTVDRT
jgi:hypothetical protein